MGKKRFNVDDMIDDVNNVINSTNNAQASTPSLVQEIKIKSHTEPDRLYRRNITLSEEQLRRLEFIKKSKNKAIDKKTGMITLDKIMFDMIQYCLDKQYPETKAMFEKYLELKQMEGFSDLV